MNKLIFNTAISTIIFSTCQPSNAQIPFSKEEKKALILVDGRPYTTVQYIEFSKIDPKTGNIIDTISFGGTRVKYEDPTLKGKKFFMWKFVEPGDYILTKFTMSTFITADYCFGQNAPMYHFDAGKINVVSRYDLSSLVGYATWPAKVVEEGALIIAKENVNANAISSVTGDYDHTKDLQVLSPTGIYTIQKSDGSFGKCTKIGKAIRIK